MTAIWFWFLLGSLFEQFPAIGHWIEIEFPDPNAAHVLINPAVRAEEKVGYLVVETAHQYQEPQGHGHRSSVSMWMLDCDRGSGGKSGTVYYQEHSFECPCKAGSAFLTPDRFEQSKEVVSLCGTIAHLQEDGQLE